MPSKIIDVKSYSDGDPSHCPGAGWVAVVPPTIYLEKLATLWVQNHGQHINGTKFYLERLPASYRLFEKARNKNPSYRDKRLFGHPSHKFFDSPNRFYPHFEHLMLHGSNIPKADTTVEDMKKRGGPPLAKKKDVDPLRALIDKLKLHSTLSEEYRENLNMDWRSEQKLLHDSVLTAASRRSWLPRLGEVVLFVRSLGGEICRDDDTKQYKVFDVANEKFIGDPPWEAGVITQIPEEMLQIQDVLAETDKDLNVTYSGFRVEPLPDPLGKDKRVSKQYKYVPAHHIRPFVFWHDFLNAIPGSDWHLTIKHALTIVSSVSMLGKYRFKGVWPTADLHCHAMYVGSELICVGDAIRLTPAPAASDMDRVTDVLHVTTIKLHMTNLDTAGTDDADEGHPYNSTAQLFGKAYTIDKSRAWSAAPLTQQEMLQTLPSVMTSYHSWYPLHNPQLFFQVPFTRVLGRLYEEEAMQLWFPKSQAEESSTSINNAKKVNENVNPFLLSALSQGSISVRKGREISRSRDNRILPNKAFLWTSSRGETLDIATMNGMSLSRYDTERDTDQIDIWKRATRVLEKTAGEEDKELVQGVQAAKRDVSGPLGIAQTDKGEGEEDGEDLAGREESYVTAGNDEEPLNGSADSGPSFQLQSEIVSNPSSSSQGGAWQKHDLATRFGLKRSSAQLDSSDNENHPKKQKRYPVVVVPLKSPSLEPRSKRDADESRPQGSMQQAKSMLARFRAPKNDRQSSDIKSEATSTETIMDEVAG
ncbi:MAG: hypothetical protein M1828_002962 [Chrysothrix sp. TS-e1954]|nr:MAG: hypothetical protein M1828_002962 [Chrysothrix sp. TS-e1954]